jgi:hypothetical protein
VNVVVGHAEKGQQYGVENFILENRDIRALVESRAVTEGC